MLKFTPDHLVYHAYVALDDADDLGGNILVHVVRDGDAVVAVLDEAHRHIDALQQADRVDAAQHEATFVQRLGTLGAGADANGRERMTN